MSRVLEGKTAICPTVVSTDMTTESGVFDDAPTDPTVLDPSLLDILQKRYDLTFPMIDPEDVADSALFLASDAGKMINGEILEVTRGEYI